MKNDYDQTIQTNINSYYLEWFNDYHIIHNYKN